MLNTKSFLAVDFGAGTLKVAEFEVNEAGGLRLKQYGLKPLGAEGAQETAREGVILKALQEIAAEKGIKAKNLNACAPGFHVFSKFVKLPPVDAGKVGQIIEYEAKQNVPFPLEEVVWDYQILGSTGGGELEVFLVAIKAEIVEGLYRVTETAGLKQQLADVSPAALCNAFRYNYGDLEDCSMLLDIGAKTSNLLFFEKGKVFSRSINLGANSITQDFINEAKIKFDVGEKIKIEEGFVSLGGAYEEPENPHQAAISKIARQFMTRLHIQVNQTMQFYRGTQGGSAPQRLFLAGGASIMPYTAQFFAEKLNVPVEYFNPLRNVQIDPSINLEELARVAHSLGEVVGLGLRNLAHCPIELNLMPESTLKWQAFNQKKPYFIATVFSLVLVVAAMGWIFNRLASVRTATLEKVKNEISPRQAKSELFRRADDEKQKAQKDANQVADWMEARFYWADVCKELREVMIRAEAGMRAKFRAETGVWIEQFALNVSATEHAELNPLAPAAPAAPAGDETPERRAYLKRYGIEVGRRAPPPGDTAPPPPDAGAAPAPGPRGGAAKPPGSNDMILNITCRAVSLVHVSSTANPDMAFAVESELKNSPMFDPEGTQVPSSSSISPDDANGTFTFPVTIKLKRPLKL